MESRIKVTLIRRHILRFLQQNKPVAIEFFTDVPGSFAILQQRCMEEELSQEHAKLLNLFSNTLPLSTIKHEFKQLCHLRWQEIKGSSLSYCATKFSECNKLYWSITSQLFAPKSLIEVLAILMPDISYLLTCHFAVESKKPGLISLKERINMLFQPVSIAKLEDMRTNIDALNEYVISEKYIYPITQMQNLSFLLHQKLYQRLEDYPNLKAVLYSYNDELQQLEYNIKLMDNEGLTPREAIESLIFHLIRSGTRYTNQFNAARPALLACARFEMYLNKFSDKDKENLLSLRGGNCSLQGTLEKLANGECVEAVADNLKRILESNHSSFLNKVPTLSEDMRASLKNKYQKGINVLGVDPSIKLPQRIKAMVLPKIIIHNYSDCLDLFLNFPTAEYLDLLSNIKVSTSFKQLFFPIADHFSREQKHTLIKIFIETPEFLNGKDNVLNFIILAAELEFLDKLYPRKELLTKLTEKFTGSDMDNPLVLAAYHHNPNVLTTLISYYKPGTQRMNIAMAGSGRIFSVLLESAYPEKLSQFLSLFTPHENDQLLLKKYPPTQANAFNRCIALNQYSHFEVLFSAASEKLQAETIKQYSSNFKDFMLMLALQGSPKLWSIFWNAMSKNTRKKKLFANKCALFKSILNNKDSEILKILMQSFSRKVLENAVMHGSCLHFAAQFSSPKSMEMLLQIFTKTEYRDFLKINGILLEAVAANNIETFKYLLSLFTLNERKGIFFWLNNEANDLLSYAIYNNSDSLPILFEGMTACECVEIIDLKDDMGISYLHLSLKNPPSFCELIKFFPENERYEKLQEKMGEASTQTMLDAIPLKFSVATMEKLLALLPLPDRIKFVANCDDAGLNIMENILRVGGYTCLEKYLKLFPDQIHNTLINLEGKNCHAIYLAAVKKRNYNDLMRILEKHFNDEEVVQLLTKKYTKSSILSCFKRNFVPYYSNINLKTVYLDALQTTAFRKIYQSVYANHIPDDQFYAKYGHLSSLKLCQAIKDAPKNSLACTIWDFISEFKIKYNENDLPRLIEHASQKYKEKYQLNEDFSPQRKRSRADQSQQTSLKRKEHPALLFSGREDKTRRIISNPKLQR